MAVLSMTCLKKIFRLIFFSCGCRSSLPEDEIKSMMAEFEPNENIEIGNVNPIPAASVDCSLVDPKKCSAPAGTAAEIVTFASSMNIQDMRHLLDTYDCSNIINAKDSNKNNFVVG